MKAIIISKVQSPTAQSFKLNVNETAYESPLLQSNDFLLT